MRMPQRASMRSASPDSERLSFAGPGCRPRGHEGLRDAPGERGRRLRGALLSSRQGGGSEEHPAQTEIAGHLTCCHSATTYLLMIVPTPCASTITALMGDKGTPNRVIGQQVHEERLGPVPAGSPFGLWNTSTVTWTSWNAAALAANDAFPALILKSPFGKNSPPKRLP